MRTQLKVSFGDQEIARETHISMNTEFIAENFLRCPECDCLCLDGCPVTDVNTVCVELDISEGTAIEQHRFFRQRQNWMSAVNRIFITSCLQDKSAVCILIFSFTVHIRDVFCR